MNIKRIVPYLMLVAMVMCAVGTQGLFAMEQFDPESSSNPFKNIKFPSGETFHTISSDEPSLLSKAKSLFYE